MEWSSFDSRLTEDGQIVDEASGASMAGLLTADQIREVPKRRI